jgi:hypothetical protein
MKTSKNVSHKCATGGISEVTIIFEKYLNVEWDKRSTEKHRIVKNIEMTKHHMVNNDKRAKG